jgi:hypothetical protein
VSKPILDPSMLGQTKYARVPLDFYPTPTRATEAFIGSTKHWWEDRVVAEPACGNGAIAKVIAPHCRSVVSTDIHAYDGHQPDAMVDFLEVKDYQEYCEKAGGKPTAIITNPPYGKLAEAFAWKSIQLMEECQGFVAMLCRHEWDAAKGRGPLFDHMAYSAKVTLRFRPRWVEGSSGAPRFSYAWYCWDWSRAGEKPVCLYAQ